MAGANVEIYRTDVLIQLTALIGLRLTHMTQLVLKMIRMTQLVLKMTRMTQLVLKIIRKFVQLIPELNQLTVDLMIIDWLLQFPAVGVFRSEHASSVAAISRAMMT